MGSCHRLPFLKFAAFSFKFSSCLSMGSSFFQSFVLGYCPLKIMIHHKKNSSTKIELKNNHVIHLPQLDCREPIKVDCGKVTILFLSLSMYKLTKK